MTVAYSDCMRIALTRSAARLNRASRPTERMNSSPAKGRPALTRLGPRAGKRRPKVPENASITRLTLGRCWALSGGAQAVEGRYGTENNDSWGKRLHRQRA